MSGKKWREFFVRVAKHPGEYWTLDIDKKPRYWDKHPEDYDRYILVENAALEEKQAQIKELVGALNKVCKLVQVNSIEPEFLVEAKEVLNKHKGADSE